MKSLNSRKRLVANLKFVQIVVRSPAEIADLNVLVTDVSPNRQFLVNCYALTVTKIAEISLAPVLVEIQITFLLRKVALVLLLPHNALGDVVLLLLHILLVTLTSLKKWSISSIKATLWKEKLSDI